MSKSVPTFMTQKSPRTVNRTDAPPKARTKGISQRGWAFLVLMVPCKR